VGRINPPTTATPTTTTTNVGTSRKKGIHCN